MWCTKAISLLATQREALGLWASSWWLGSCWCSGAWQRVGMKMVPTGWSKAAGERWFLPGKKRKKKDGCQSLSLKQAGSWTFQSDVFPEWLPFNAWRQANDPFPQMVWLPLGQLLTCWVLERVSLNMQVGFQSDVFWDKNWEPRKHPSIYGKLISNQGAKNTQWEKTVLSTDGAGKTGQSQVKNETWPLCYTNRNNNLKWTVRPKTMKLLAENIF